MHQNMPVPRFKLSSFSHFVTTASSYPKPEPRALGPSAIKHLASRVFWKSTEFNFRDDLYSLIRTCLKTQGDYRQSGTLFVFHPVTDILVTVSIK